MFHQFFEGRVFIPQPDPFRIPDELPILASALILLKDLERGDGCCNFLWPLVRLLDRAVLVEELPQVGERNMASLTQDIRFTDLGAFGSGVTQGGDSRPYLALMQ